MSEVWSEFVTMASHLTTNEDAMRLMIVAVAVVVGLAALAGLLLRRRARRADSRLSPPTGAYATERTQQSTSATPSPNTDQYTDPANADQRSVTPGPARGGTTHPLRHGSEWHVIGRPSVASQPVRSASGTVSAVPSASVAVAERQTGPLPVDLIVEAERAETIATAGTPPDLAAQTEADYQRGHRLLAQMEDDRADALRRALAYFRRAQEVWTLEAMPERWAMLQNDIGRVYQELPDGDRAAHLRTAILYHQTALEVFDPVRQPMNWAWTQSALGAAYQSLPVGSTLANARAAIAYHQRALDVFTAENAPLAWAWNQNNLGTALETMPGGPEGGRVEHLRDAARAYAAALEVYTAERYPAQHHIVTRNLARVEAELKSLE